MFRLVKFQIPGICSELKGVSCESLGSINPLCCLFVRKEFGKKDTFRQKGDVKNIFASSIINFLKMENQNGKEKRRKKESREEKRRKKETCKEKGRKKEKSGKKEKSKQEEEKITLIDSLSRI
ncbi:MAG: hypothetical protein HQM13_04955 [SAR324 cluster bacterium]|nr:hypothetical protein [SAR324 cluster bacterium]